MEVLPVGEAFFSLGGSWLQNHSVFPKCRSQVRNLGNKGFQLSLYYHEFRFFAPELCFQFADSMTKKLNRSYQEGRRFFLTSFGCEIPS